MAIGLTVAAIVGVLAIIIALTPTPQGIKPVAFTFEFAGANFTGIYEPNDLLTKGVRRIGTNLHGPETVTFDKDGNAYGFTTDGAVSLIDLETGTKTEWAYVGGRPLAGEFDANGDLYVCDAVKGLLHVDKDTRVVTLVAARTSDGVPILFADDIEIAKDGTVYFTDANDILPWRKPDGKYATLESSIVSYLEGKASGRLLAYNPKTRETKVIYSGFYFANGIALSEDESEILVVETYGGRIRRVYLSGPKRGTDEMVVSGLPVFPDGMSRGSKSYWVACPSPQMPTTTLIAPYPALRGFISKLPAWMLPKPVKYGMIIELGFDGKVLRTLQDPSGDVITMITAVTEHNGKLYLGSLHNDYIGVYTL